MKTLQAETEVLSTQPRQKRRGCMKWGCIALVIILVVGRHLWIDFQTHLYATLRVSSGAQIMLALRQYAESSDEGLFPDGRHPEITSANAFFRELFKAELVNDERIFTDRANPHQSDNVIGSPPDFAQALAPGECHWMVLKHQSDKVHELTPIFIENAANATWPPRWKLPAAWEAWVFGVGPKRRGFASRDGHVVVGRLNGSITLEKIRPDGMLDWHSKSNLDEHGKSWIDYLTPEQVARLEYWDIEERKTP